MSNDDERMDRAKRIREMREGSREGDSDDEKADGGEPTDHPDADAADDQTADAEAESSASDGDESDEKQTMEDLVESAAAEADEEDEENGDEELELDDELSVDEELEEMDPTADEEDVVAEVADAVSDDDSTAESEPDDETEMAATDDVAEAATVEDEPDEDEESVTAPLPDTDTLEDALDETENGEDVETVAPDDEEEMPAAPGTDTDESETQQEETRVLEFRLDDEYYCLDIEYIEEIVKEETITRVPNTPEFVQGVVDLRGQITTILNPKVTLGKDSTDADQLIVVFDAEAFEDQGHIGWVVDDVRQVSPITDSEVNDPPVEEAYINGVIDREDDDQFVIWTSPDLALEEADG